MELRNSVPAVAISGRAYAMIVEQTAILYIVSRDWGAP